MRNSIIAGMLAILFISVASAEAAIIRWEIMGTAEDQNNPGDTADVFGTFIWDGGLGAFRDINVTSTGDFLDGVVYEQATVFASQTAADFVPAGPDINTGLTGQPNLSIFGPDFGDPTMLLISLDGSFGFLQECTDEDCRSADQFGAVIGSIHGTVVPLPAAAWLMLGGLGALGAVARKRRA